MRTRLVTIAALVGAGALTLNAQTPTPQTPSNPQTPATQTSRPTDQQPRAAAGMQQVTVTGCLKAEKDVPGRSPNVAERAGMGEDYILTDVKMAQSSAQSGIGLATMYKVEGISDDELKKHLNHQVEITGRIDQGDRMGNRGAAANPGAQAGAKADLPDFNGTTLKMVSATCPAK